MNPFTPVDALPDPWNNRFLAILVGASVATTIAVCWRDGSSAIVPGLIVLVVAIVVVLFAPRVVGGGADRKPLNPVVRLIVAPLLLGLPFIVTATLMGNAGAGGYPAAIAAFFALVILSTREMELHARTHPNDEEEMPVHSIYHRPLGWISAVFFLFGVLTLWPWLGKLYGTGYFWVLILGVLAPTLFFWNRLRQPHKHHSLPALIRFNHVLPYIAFILLIAFWVG